jgi:RNA polymerase sigma-70 factor, ECF subfamily
VEINTLKDEMTDFEAMALIAKGDKSAFDVIVKRHQNALINYFMRYSGNLDTAAELSQEVFLRIYKARDRYKPKAKFTTYLFRVAHNLAINELIAKKRPDTKPFDNDEKIETLTTPDDNPETGTMAIEKSDTIKEAMMQLNPAERSAIILKYTQGMSYREISKSTGRSVAGVESLLIRAKTKLKTELQKRGVSAS